MERIILHIDMDAFFAQIEERENPHFKGMPLVVGADPKGGRGRGVVATANYIARKYGIHSALPISRAYRLCPKAVFLPPDHRLYKRVSESIFKIIERFSSTLESVSLDEAYIDISFLKNYKEAKELAKKLKAEIIKKQKLTSTIGIGSNKLIAKLASEKAKPDGLLIIKSSQIRKFLEPLDIQDLPGIGPKTAQKLRAIDIYTIKDIKKLTKFKLIEMFGVAGEKIYEKARGIDKSFVKSYDIIKSIGKEYTFEKDTRDSELIFKIFNELIRKVHKEILKNNFHFRTLTVICRFQDFETHTKAKTFKNSTNNLIILKKESKKLFLKFIVESPKLIRLIGLRVSGLVYKK